MSTIAEQLIEEGREEGRDEGREEGREVGLLSGKIQVFEKLLGQPVTPIDVLVKSTTEDLAERLLKLEETFQAQQNKKA